MANIQIPKYRYVSSVDAIDDKFADALLKGRNNPLIQIGEIGAGAKFYSVNWSGSTQVKLTRTNQIGGKLERSLCLLGFLSRAYDFFTLNGYREQSSEIVAAKLNSLLVTVLQEKAANQLEMKRDVLADAVPTLKLSLDGLLEKASKLVSIDLKEAGGHPGPTPCADVRTQTRALIEKKISAFKEAYEKAQAFKLNDQEKLNVLGDKDRFDGLNGEEKEVHFNYVKNVIEEMQQLSTDLHEKLVGSNLQEEVGKFNSIETSLMQSANKFKQYAELSSWVGKLKENRVPASWKPCEKAFKTLEAALQRKASLETINKTITNLSKCLEKLAADKPIQDVWNESIKRHENSVVELENQLDDMNRTLKIVTTDQTKMCSEISKQLKQLYRSEITNASFPTLAKIGEMIVGLGESINGLRNSHKVQLQQDEIQRALDKLNTVDLTALNNAGSTGPLSEFFAAKKEEFSQRKEELESKLNSLTLQLGTLKEQINLGEFKDDLEKISGLIKSKITEVNSFQSEVNAFPERYQNLMNSGEVIAFGQAIKEVVNEEETEVGKYLYSQARQCIPHLFKDGSQLNENNAEGFFVPSQKNREQLMKCRTLFSEEMRADIEESVQKASWLKKSSDDYFAQIDELKFMLTNSLSWSFIDQKVDALSVWSNLLVSK